MPTLSPTPEQRAAKAAYAREWRAQNRERVNTRRRLTRTPEQTRARKLKVLYNLTPADYEGMEIAQDGRCRACGNPETAIGNHGRVKRLAVDHDHETGAVRGLLCQSCNMALGLVDDDVQRLQALIDYLVA